MGVLTKHLREHREAMRQEQEAGDAKNPAFWRCRTHGPAKAGAWGCPECVSEMRTELMFVRRVLCDLMQTGVAQQTLWALRGGQGTNTKDGEAWLAAASFAKAAGEDGDG